MYYYVSGKERHMCDPGRNLGRETIIVLGHIFFVIKSFS